MDSALIDAKDLVLGRLASVVAQRILKKENIDIVNAEKAVINGNKEFTIGKYKSKVDKLTKRDPEIGPKYPKKPDGIMRRAIRNMLPHKEARGMDALRRVRVHVGIPEKFSGKKLETIESAKAKGNKAFIELGELSTRLGAKW